MTMALPSDLDVVPACGDQTKPLVLLLHGTSGNKDDMVDPDSGNAFAGSKFNYDIRGPMAPDRDDGWYFTPPTIYGWLSNLEPDPLKPVTSWREFLGAQGYRTAAYSQIDQTGTLDRPVKELREVIGYLRSNFPNTKLVLLAHSRGGLLVRLFLKQNARDQFLVGNIGAVITLHSTHHGTTVANRAVDINRRIENSITSSPLPLQPLIRGAIGWLQNLVNSPAFVEQAVGSRFLTDLQANETPLPGVTYATFGGTSVCMMRVRKWKYKESSFAAQWAFPPYHHIRSQHVLAVIPPTQFFGDLQIPELTPGVGDILTTDTGARLPFATHGSSPRNHAEAMWDSDLQQRVLAVLQSIHSTPEPTLAACYGSILEMKHDATGMTLHSHSINYGQPGSSGQQQVTAWNGADANDQWLVKGPYGEPSTYRRGQSVRHGDVIRLEHRQTRRNLHSHSGHPSPVTRQQEVSCFGTAGQGDINDNWRIEVEGEGEWTTGKRYKLIHVATSVALHSHAGQSHPQWTMGQQEVTGFANRDNNDWWCLWRIGTT
jgi:hypothetical protein